MAIKDLAKTLDAPFIVAWWIVAIFATVIYIGMDIAFGSFYLAMGTAGATTTFMVILLTDERRVWKVASFPFKSNKYSNAAWFWIGFLVFFLPSLVTNILQRLLPPFAILAQQEWQTLAITTVSFGRLLNIGIIAPVLEEIMWIAIFLAVVTVAGAMVEKNGKELTPLAKISIFSLGIIAVAISFSLTHFLNPAAYATAGDFIFAMSWRAFVSVLIFKYSLGSFAFGAHMGSNFAAIGLTAVFVGAFGSLLGVGILILFMLPAILLLIGRKQLSWKMLWKS